VVGRLHREELSHVPKVTERGEDLSGGKPKPVCLESSLNACHGQPAPMTEQKSLDDLGHSYKIKNFYNKHIGHLDGL